MLQESKEEWEGCQQDIGPTNGVRAQFGPDDVEEASLEPVDRGVHRTSCLPNKARGNAIRGAQSTWRAISTTVHDKEPSC